MFILLLQTICVLSSVAFGAWLVGGLRARDVPLPPAETISTVGLLPDPDRAQVRDIQQGMALLTSAISRLESTQATPEDYAEAQNLAQWTLAAGRATEHRLARQLEADGRMDAEAARKVIERGLAAQVPQRTLATVTGWSKGWVADQCKRLTSGS